MLLRDPSLCLKNVSSQDDSLRRNVPWLFALTPSIL
jgi:hypothetical protein